MRHDTGKLKKLEVAPRPSFPARPLETGLGMGENLALLTSKQKPRGRASGQRGGASKILIRKTALGGKGGKGGSVVWQESSFCIR